MDKLEKQIANLKARIQISEDTDTAYLVDELKELRHYVLYVHLRLESSIEILLATKLMSPIDKGSDLAERALWLYHMNTLFKEIDFARKAKVAFKLKAISKNLKSKAFQVNDIRKWFAHPKEYHNEIQELRDEQKYVNALKKLVGALEELDKLFSSLEKSSRTIKTQKK